MSNSIVPNVINFKDQNPIQFYNKYCKSLDFMTFSQVKKQVIKYITENKCSSDIKIIFAEWMFTKIFMNFKFNDEDIEKYCLILRSPIKACKNTIMKGKYLKFHEYKAVNNLALHFYINRFQHPDTYFVLQLMNDIQLVKGYVQDPNLSDEDLKNNLITWLESSKIPEQQYNILDVLLKYYSNDLRVKEICERMRWAEDHHEKGSIKKTLYGDAQNVHDSSISVSTKDAAARLILWDKKDLEEIESFDENVPQEQNEKSARKSSRLITTVPFELVCKSFLSKNCPELSKSDIDAVVTRMCIDTTSFDGTIISPKNSKKIEVSFSIADLFTCLVNWIKTPGNKSNQKTLLNILADELKAMKAMCSSGYMARLINVVQGFSEQFQVTLPFEKQLFAVLAKRINDSMADAGENVIMGAIDDEYKNEYIDFIKSIVNDELPSIMNEYGKSDVEIALIGVLNEITEDNNWRYNFDQNKVEYLTSK